MTDAPAWAKGHPLAFLKELAAVFAAEMKPHSYGAFGLPKERDVADAMSDGAAIWTRHPNPDGPITAAAIFRPVRRPQPHEDFSGRVAQMRPGDLFIRHMAGSREAKLHLLAVLNERAAPAAIWWEAHVEAPEVQAIASGPEWRFERVLTKVAASSDLKALFLWERIANAERRPSPLSAADEPGVKVLLADFLTEEAQAQVLAELEAFGDHWAQHYSSYNKGKSWTSFALHGYDASDPGFIIKPAEMSKQWKAENPKRLPMRCAPTLAAQHFPRTLEFVSRIPGAGSPPNRGLQRVRFMRLSASGGELTRHADITDPEAGTAEGKVARLHIPIRTSPACVFRSWGLDGQEHRLHMPERALSYIDTRKPHAVVNPSEVERVHLVVDIFATEPLRALLAA